jgi:diguanylate cyclase (GGDEF)-like protein
VQHVKALLDASGDRAHPDADIAAPRPLAGRPALTALPRKRLRSLTRRAHVRLPGATAATVERLAWGDTGAQGRVPTAVSVVPGAALPVAFRRDVVAGADLDLVVGPIEAGVAPGRHRRPHPAWTLLKRLPGWRPLDAVDPPEADTSDVDGSASHDTDTGFDGLPSEDIVLDELTYEVSASEDDTAELPAIPLPGAPDPEETVRRRRRRRQPAPATRVALQAAQTRIDAAPDRPGIARAAAEEAVRLVEADVAALVLRTVEGPRVLWLHPGGPDAEGLWGPATLAALVRVGHPVRRVVEGDPLADGEATALLTVPVPAAGTVVGALIARRNEPRTFSAIEQDVLSRLARMAGAALLNASRPLPLGRTDVDPVTGLPGSRRFTSDVEAAVRTSQRQGTPVAVLAAHIDGLARLRAELGDPPADDALRELARGLASVLRVGDLAYRIGPDQLALLLPATDETALDAVRERLAGVVGTVVTGLRLPGGPRTVTLRSASVPLGGVGAGRQVLDAATDALNLDRQKVRWTPAAS